MNHKKIILLFTILLIVIFIAGYFTIKYVRDREEEKNEYTPQQEISDEQLRETIVSLYFLDKETNMLKPEARLVSVKDVLNSPYSVLVELLISGPKNEKLQAIIPENTKLLSTKLDGECLIIDFSEEILNYNKEKENAKDMLIKSIVKTVTELNEVNKVKILINGQENNELKI